MAAPAPAWRDDTLHTYICTVQNKFYDQHHASYLNIHIRRTCRSLADAEQVNGKIIEFIKNEHRKRIENHFYVHNSHNGFY